MTLKKFGKFILVFALSFSWIFSGWPQIFNFPAETEHVIATIGTVVTNGAGGTGTNAWTNASNANGTTDNNTYATAAPAKNATVNGEWSTYGFDSVIPTDAVITKVEIIPQYKVSTTSSVATLNIQSVVSGTNCPTTALTDTAEPLSDTDVVKDITSCRSWTRTDLLDANFKTLIGAKRGNSNNAVTFSLDYVKVQVTYNTPTFEQAAYRFFNNANSTDVGTTLAAQDTAASLVSTGDAFRLRMLLHIGDDQLGASIDNFKLQFATKSGTCDTGFSGETYADVTGATAIAYSTANTPADGDNLTGNANDPTHGGDTIVNQDYEETNNFTNSVAAIPAGQDGKWDFSLIDNGAPASTSYCFRIRKSDDTNIDTYTVIPEITTSSGVAPPTLTFSISDNSIGFGTLSSADDFFANGAGTGSATEVEAHTISASTNGTSGYTITVNGTTLTSGGNTISAIGGTNTSSSAGTEQFGLRMTASGGNGAVSAPYAAAGFAFDAAAFPDPVASDPDGDDITTTYSARYLGNISTLTEAGSYSATLTYVITASF